MVTKIDLQDSVTLKMAGSIVSICKPLRDIYNISYFRYMKLFNDGTRFILCSMPDVMKYFYEEGQYPFAWHDQAKPAYIHDSGFIMWAIKRLSDSNEQKSIAAEMSNLFNINQGMAYIEKHPDWIEIFDFGSPDLNVYDIKKTIISRFTFYFKQQARNLIEKSNYERIKIPQLAGNVDNNSFLDDIFLQKIKTTKYYLSGKFEGIYLTDREIDCLICSLEGKTADEASRCLNVSKKTFERHLENVKIKLGCRKQSQLINLFIKLGIVDVNDIKPLISK